MEVLLFPNKNSPGVGLRPRREAQRPMLPQHARHCPVLEAGSTLGYLVFPPLQSHEGFNVSYDGNGHYRFAYRINPSGRKWDGVFEVLITLPVGNFGIFAQEVRFAPGVPRTDPEVAVQLMRRFIVPADLGTPAGAITLRGAWNFKTPPGWDSVYSPVFNSIERPVAPMLVVRVETDWYAHESEFRYVLQSGERMSIEHSMPIGQVFFVSREPVTLRDCSEDEVRGIEESHARFSEEKAAVRITTPYGLPYSPHYLRTSRSQSTANEQSVEVRVPLAQTQATASSIASPMPHDTHARSVGRNDPCPCGSGKKYKKCHGL